MRGRVPAEAVSAPSATPAAGNRATGPRRAARRVLGDALPKDEPDRRAQEAILGPDSVLQVAPIAEMDQLRIVDEDDEGRRADRHLRRVEDLRLPVPNVRRRMLA